MADTPQLSGPDLARQALAAYKATARTAPTAGPARTVRKRTTRSGDRRDPMPLAAAIAALGADLPLEGGLAGGSIIDQWATLCPQYAGLVQPIRYDEHTGRLELRPGSHSYAAQLRMFGGQLAEQINTKMGRPVVRTIRVLPVGNIDGTPLPAAAPNQPEPAAPVRTRETASPGYRATLEAALAHKPQRSATTPHVADAIERQETALRANREPETAHREAYWEMDRMKAAEEDRGEAVRRAALARKRQEQSAGGSSVPRRAFDAA